jgi:hypothetical protein
MESIVASFNDTTCLPGGSERSCIRMDLVNHMIDTIKMENSMKHL